MAPSPMNPIFMAGNDRRAGADAVREIRAPHPALRATLSRWERDETKKAPRWAAPLAISGTFIETLRHALQRERGSFSNCPRRHAHSPALPWLGPRWARN